MFQRWNLRLSVFFLFSPQINSIVGPFAVYWNVFDCQEHFMHVCSDILQGQTWLGSSQTTQQHAGGDPNASQTSFSNWIKKRKQNRNVQSEKKVSEGSSYGDKEDKKETPPLPWKPPGKLPWQQLVSTFPCRSSFIQVILIYKGLAKSHPDCQNQVEDMWWEAGTFR